MNKQTLSLVKLAQELCTSGQTPRTATTNLLIAAHQHADLAYLLEACQEQAIQELERRFSGCVVKPWDTDTYLLGYSLECIRHLLRLAESTGHEEAVAVKVAQRFLKEIEEGKHG